MSVFLHLGKAALVVDVDVDHACDFLFFADALDHVACFHLRGDAVAGIL